MMVSKGSPQPFLTNSFEPISINREKISYNKSNQEEMDFKPIQNIIINKQKEDIPFSETRNLSEILNFGLN